MPSILEPQLVASVDPEQIVLGLNRTSCLRTGAGATDQQLLLEPPASSISSLASHESHLDALEEKLTVPLRRRATVEEARLFSIRHCILLKVIDTVPKNSVEAMPFIDAATECVLFAPRCAMRCIICGRLALSRTRFTNSSHS